MTDHPHGAGKSSYDLIDVKALFSRLDLHNGSTFLDLGSGRGDYALAASAAVGERGLVYAIDAWEGSIQGLKTLMEEEGIENIRPILADAGEGLPIEDHTVDVCLMAVVFHDLVREQVHTPALAEIRRVLKPSGRLAVIEFKKREGRPGPSLEIKIAPEKLEEMLAPHGFLSDCTADFGPYTYLCLFRRKGD